MHDVIEIGICSDRDELTSFGSREALYEDISNALAPGSPPRVLAVFALEGWRELVERHGSVTGDELIAELARIFASTLPRRTRYYRPREDEFSALLDVPPVANLIAGLGVHSRLQAVVEARRRGLLHDR